jgi:nucleotide-binding universal stress UspA family protein
MKHKLLIAVDGEKASLKIIDYVARACVGSNDEFAIVVFHVLPMFPVYDYLAGANAPVGEILDWFDNQTRTAATEMLVKAKEILVKQACLKSEQVITEIAEQRGIIAPQILQAAADHKCDTIVVGRRGRSMIAAFFLGSVVEHLLRNPVGFAIWVVE